MMMSLLWASRLGRQNPKSDIGSFFRISLMCDKKDFFRYIPDREAPSTVFLNYLNHRSVDRWLLKSTHFMKPFFWLKSFLAAPFAAPKRSISCDFSHELQAMPKNLRTNCFAELLKHYVGNAFNRSVRKCIDGLRIVAEIVDLKKTSELEVPAYKFSLSCLTYFQQISRAEL